MSIQREEIPESIFVDLEVVRQSNETNMLSMVGVINSLLARQRWDTVDWLLVHETDYGSIVMQHFGDWLAEKRGEQS